MKYGELGNKIQKMRKKGKTYNEISKELNCSKGTVSYHCQKNDNNNDIIENNLNSIYKYRKEASMWKQETKDKIQYLYERGIYPLRIADALGLSYVAVRNFCSNSEFIFPDYSKAKNYERVKMRRKNLKILAIIHKGSKCSTPGCGYNKCIEALEFHHDNPSEKEFTISRLRSWKRVKKEISKCKLFCANCHRELHNNTIPDGWQ